MLLQFASCFDGSAQYAYGAHGEHVAHVGALLQSALGDGDGSGAGDGCKHGTLLYTPKVSPGSSSIMSSGSVTAVLWAFALSQHGALDCGVRSGRRAPQKQLSGLLSAAFMGRAKPTQPVHVPSVQASWHWLSVLPVTWVDGFEFFEHVLKGVPRRPSRSWRSCS